jgi:hypothetical protein
LAGKSPLAFCRSYREDVCPPTDDKPFFFNPTRLGDVGHEPKGRVFSTSPYLVLLVVLGILAALCAAAFAVPLAVVRPAGRPPLSALLFFAAIGVGFLVLEIVLIQRFVLFLGFPTYALSVVLFSLLLSTGLGSLLSGRVRRPRTALIAALATAAVLVAVAAPGLQPLLRALIDLPFAVRMAVTVALILPLGVTLGMAMPLGLGRLARLYPAGVPWAWAVNGVTSVLGSVLAVAVAITWGFTAATLVALACYLGALAHVLGARSPEAGPAHPAETARHGAKPTDLSRV